MKTILTNKFKKIATDLQTHPPVKPTFDDEGPGHILFDDEKDNKESIKERWRRKKDNTKKDIVYQTGIVVPVGDKKDDV